MNTYGPTETTVVATAHGPSAAERARPDEEAMIGRALPNVEIYVLDRHLQPVPQGCRENSTLGAQAWLVAIWSAPT